ncbi:hypothetical protein M422DRAFT_266655 [Sphaerobolus stellatus SS14]|uniref:Uncharacterized protein n=1 Tax=Sphaerobolus stellatus (strain SS14) TaxID=990650 RepID=A0A0C9UR41_SPHS4|nr:hypothetical protein M422DRAFT_266655 [Sphaerobolus stellatus SS14]
MQAFLAIETRHTSTPATHPRSVASTLLNSGGLVASRAVSGYRVDIAGLGYDQWAITGTSSNAQAIQAFSTTD